jgi:hypothetical protein
MARGEASARNPARGRTGWLTGRLVFGLMTLAAMLICVMGVVFLNGIKADADQLRSAENYLSSQPWYASGGVPSGAGAPYARAQADLVAGKAALSGPRGVICRALGFCEGLQL